MNASDVARQTRLWLRYAREDLRIARQFDENPDIVPRHACFFAQQAAEKALKSVLIAVQMDFPFKHDLELLLALLPDDCILKHDHPDLTVLTGWAVEARYPGDIPEPAEADAKEAVDTATLVLNAVCEDLTRRGFDLTN